MQEKIITFASPIFFLLIAIELLVGLRRQRNTYRLNDALNSLSLGVMSQIIGAFLKVLSVGIYAWAFRHFSFTTLPPDALWVWVSGLLLYDFFYYWLHRAGHTVNLFWAAHVVHHQSEEYNLSTALRQTSSGALLGWVFYLPLAILGYPVEVFILIALIDLLYQFWVHTQQIGKLGWFDRVFVSPSNHRVHHGVNDQYLDKNYGGILIVWDRIFGTFIEENDDEPVVYGTRSPLQSWNPLWANLEVYVGVWRDMWKCRSWRDRCRVWLKPPGWKPAELASTISRFDISHPIYNPPLTGARLWYCLLHFTVLLQVTTHYLLSFQQATLMQSAGYGLWLIAGLASIGGIMQGLRQYHWIEAARLLLTMAIALNASWFGLVALPAWAQLGISVVGIASLVFLYFVDSHGHHSHS